MKELSVEEKAQRYDEAIKVAKSNYETIVQMDNDCTFAKEGIVNTFHHMFPELQESKESDDEKVRNEIIAFVEQAIHRGGGTPVPQEQEDSWIAWLEKQGEQSNLIELQKAYTEIGRLVEENYRLKKQSEQKSFARYKVGDTIYYDSFGRLVSFVIANIVEDGTDNPMYEDKDGNSVFQNDIVEQKLTPIFRIGDTVIAKDGTSIMKEPFHIDSIEDGCYWDGENTILICNQDEFELAEQKSTDKVEPKFHEGEWVTDGTSVFQIVKIEGEWYIADDGDRVCFDVVHQYYHLWTIQDAKDGDVLATNSWLYIFKYTNNKALIQFHCTCPINKKPYKWCFSLDDSYLDIYIDANIHPATKEQCDQLEKTMADAGYTFDFEKKELKKIEQNHLEWSEEDERIRQDIENLIRFALEGGSAVSPAAHTTKEDAICWMQSIKERYTWKPSSEQIEALDCAINVGRVAFEDEAILKELLEQLKAL